MILKNQSVDSDHKKFAGSLFADLEAMGQKIATSIINQLDKPRVNNEDISQDERVSAQEAMKRIEVEKKIARIVKKYADEIIPIRNDYYRATMFKLAAVFNKNLQPDLAEFTSMKVSFTKKEISTITEFVESVTLKAHLMNLRARANFRMQQIVLESYKEIPKIKKVYRQTYSDNLRGAMRRLNQSFRGLTNGLFVEVFEQAESRWLGAINGL